MHLPVHFLTPLTDALYSEVGDFFSRENLRDAFSSGQLHSKIRFYESIARLNIKPKSIHHLGCWHGLLSLWLAKLWQCKVNLVEIDDNSLKLAQHINNNSTSFLLDANEYCLTNYIDTESLVINTSCEHMSKNWTDSIPLSTLVAAQSTDYLSGEGHTNCVKTIEEFEAQLNLSSILYSETYVFPMYKRFSVVGVK